MTVRAVVDHQPDAGPARVIRVASVPEAHVYVQHLSAPGRDERILRLPDPPPNHPAPEPGQWWPPAMLDPGWVRDNADDFDVFHLHFGFDALAPADLEAVLDALERHGKPMVYTVHDLRNPHHADRATHDAHLDLLLARATALVTLTPGAAAAIERRCGRRPTVLPHPHVVEFERMRRPAVNRPVDTFTVGVHAKGVRANMDPAPVVAALLPLARTLPGFRLVVDVHHDVADLELMRLLTDAAAAHELELHVHDRYTDDELWTYLESLDLSVLPYRFGTHSGWLEACHDLGTAVLAPSCGFFAEQRPCLTYGHDERGLDAESLRAAATLAYEQRPAWRAAPAARISERSAIADAHRELYESVLAVPQ